VAELKIAFLGTSASGKSTLAMELTAYLTKKGYSATYVVEIARSSIEKYGMLDNIYKQKLAITEQREIEKRAEQYYDIIICDNPILGYIPWTFNVMDWQDKRQVSLFFSMLEEAFFLSKDYSIFFYLPYLEVKTDKIRKHNQQTVKAVDQQIESLLKMFQFPYKKIQSNDKVDGEGARLAEVIKTLEENKCFHNLKN